ncbi:PspC domain-containing protein [Nocardia sp. NPDC058176]|uniref:PspC domain-containing protein n=1 Tax=Nocardia sp. NPDC058176 TaxID=3346368 RepID=UPI0036DA1705
MSSRTSFADQVQQMWHTRPVRLPRQGPIAGVAAGFGLRYGIDPVLLRVAFVVSTIFGGAGIVLYLLAWLVLSSAGDEASAAEALTGNGRSSQSQTKTIVLIVALAIAVSTMGPIGMGLGGSGVISMGLMLGGWWMLYLRHPELPTGFDAYRHNAVGATGYPGAGYPTGAPVSGYSYTPEPPTGMYTPYTKLPDAYVPDPATNVPPRAENRTDTAESTPLLRVDATETVVLHKDVDDTGTTEVIPVATPEGTADLNWAATESRSPAPESTDTSGSATGTVEPVAAEATPDTPSTDATAADSATSAPSDVRLVDDSTSTDEPAAIDLGKHDAESSTPTEPAAPTTGTTPRTTGATDDALSAETPSPTANLRKEPTTPTPGFPRTRAQVPHGWDPLAVAPLAWELPEAAPQYAAVVAPPPKKPRSRLTPVTIGLAILAAAVAGAVAASGAEWMTPARIGAFALAVVGLGLIAGAFLRRGYGLLVLTAPLAGFVMLASLIGPIDFEGNAMGERTWAPTSVAELQPNYTMTMGSATLDLREMPLTEPRAVQVSVNMGEAIVLLPEGMRVNTTCDVRAGDATNCKEGLTGPDTPDAPVLDLRVVVRMGSVEVTRG